MQTLSCFLKGKKGQIFWGDFAGTFVFSVTKKAIIGVTY